MDPPKVQFIYSLWVFKRRKTSELNLPSKSKTMIYLKKTFFISDFSSSLDNNEGTKENEKALVIPEKASSFKVHPTRLCLDQCYYCGGKFGLYDTPCHIAQIKGTTRQENILKSMLRIFSKFQLFSLF